MAVTETPQVVVSAARVPGPPELLPGRPDAIVDLQADEGAALVGGQWRYSDARVEEIGFVELAGPGAPDPLGPGDVPNRTYDELPLALGLTGGQVVAGFNSPNRVLLTRDARPGERFQIAVFGINGPISVSPRNYIWMRTATLDFYSAERAGTAWEAPVGIDRLDSRLDELVPADVRLERVAGGFEFTEGPVWARDGALLFSSPNTNAIYRWTPEGAVT